MDENRRFELFSGEKIETERSEGPEGREASRRSVSPTRGTILSQHVSKYMPEQTLHDYEGEQGKVVWHRTHLSVYTNNNIFLVGCEGCNNDSFFIYTDTIKKCQNNLPPISLIKSDEMSQTINIIKSWAIQNNISITLS